MKRRAYPQTARAAASYLTTGGNVVTERSGGGGGCSGGYSSGCSGGANGPLRVDRYDPFFYDERTASHRLTDQGDATRVTFARLPDRTESATERVAFALADEARQTTAVNDVQFYATTTATLPEEGQYAFALREPVTCPSERVAENVDEWTGAWAQQAVSNWHA